MQSVLDWMTANWALAIPLVFTLLGLTLHFSSDSAKVVALKNALLALGVDIPKLVAAIQDLLSSTPPAGGAGSGPSNVTKQAVKDDPAVTMVQRSGVPNAWRTGAAGVALFVGVSLVSACVSGCAAGLPSVAQWAASAQGTVQAVEAVADTVVSDAGLALGAAKVFLSPADAAIAQADWDKALASYDRAKTAVNDLLLAAADASQPNPNLGGAVAAVVDAVNQIVQVVDTWTGKTAARAAMAGPGALDDAHAGAAKMAARWGAKAGRK